MFHAHTPSFIRINNHNDRNQVSKDYLNDLMPLFQSTLQNATNQMTKIITIFNELDAFRIIEFIKPLKYFESQCFFSTIVFFSLSTIRICKVFHFRTRKANFPQALKQSNHSINLLEN